MEHASCEGTELNSANADLVIWIVVLCDITEILYCFFLRLHDCYHQFC